MTDPPTRTSAPKLKVVVADDDVFISSLVSEGLRSQGFAVATALTTAEAWELVTREEPHALVSDLNFGAGESAAALLTRVHEERPWIGLVVLTSHLSPELAIRDAGSLPAGTVYLVKTQLNRLEDLKDAVMKAISGTNVSANEVGTDTIRLTHSQAEALRMLAEGASTRSIAEQRGTSVRAAEMMLSRLYAVLGLASDDASNNRVAAVQLWQQGRVALQSPSRAEAPG